MTSPLRQMWKEATRTCETCGRVFGRADKPKTIYSAFMRLRFCSPQCSHKASAGDPVEIFWSKVEKSEGCWLWRGYLGPTGYGNHWNGASKAKHIRAHRYSYELANGPIPNGAQVLHECDVRNCVNPDHLWLGDHAANMRDRSQKGRTFRRIGESHHAAKLTTEQVLSIRGDPRTAKELASEYPIGRSGIEAIKSGRTWRHL